MAGRGPPPTPSKILEARGSWRAGYRETHGEPRAPAGKPKRPRYLTRPQCRIWRQIIGHLEALGLMTSVDGYAVEQLAVAIDLWRREAVRAGKDTILRKVEKDADGQEIPGTAEYQVAPWVLVMDRLAKQIDRLFQGFGLMPAYRARILTGASEPVREEDESDKVRKFINFGGA